MADIDLKTLTPDTSLPTTGFLFGADSQASASPSVYSTQTVATTLLGSTSLTGATITTSQPVLDLAQTWNAGAVTFTGLKFNATDTASAAASLLMDLQVGGSSRFRVGKSGTIGLSGNAPSLSFSINDPGGTARMLQYNLADNNGSIYWDDLTLSRRGTANLRLGAADAAATTATVTITIAAPGVVTWTGHTLSTGTPVVFTTTGALPTGITAGTTYYAVVVDANTFQIASSVANAIATPATVITTSGTQSGTHTGTRYNITQRLGMQSVTGVADRLGADLLIQGSQGTGTGAGGSIVFQVAPAGTAGTAQNALATAWSISGAGHFLAGADNTYDIGASSASRPRNVYVASSLTVTGGGNDVAITNTGQISFASNARLKRSSTTLQVRNGGDTDFTNIQGKLTTETAYTAGAPTATGYLIIYDSNGTAYRVPAVAN